MPVRSFKPVTPSLRFKTVYTFEEITKSKPERTLVVPLKRKGGRNNLGRITARHRGGRHQRAYRIIDFKRDKLNIPGRVAAIEYDPNRSARIALIHYVDGEKRYIIAPVGLQVNDVIISADTPEIKVGNTMPLRNVPLGSFVHNVELKIGKGGQLARSAGNYAQLLAKEKNYAQLKLPSGEIRMVHLECRATLGQVSNMEHENISVGKAGRSRWLGWRPRVRGVAMNPVDHPMGGGEGKSSGGRHPCSPWGQLAKGLKTRPRKVSDSLIIKRRKSK